MDVAYWSDRPRLVTLTTTRPLNGLAPSASVRILLLAPNLLGESLALQLTSRQSDWQVCLRPDGLKGHPQIVIWSLEKLPSLSGLQREVLQLQERWQPAPVLLLLPAGVDASRDQLLTSPLKDCFRTVTALSCRRPSPPCFREDGSFSSRRLLPA
ncbi:MAG: hypothetical protein CM15mP77_1910 [Synechococcus sp.]|nr:MAG: hypothetical protein CM15mP77_1910 [Synechococcus sp.]